MKEKSPNAVIIPVTLEIFILLAVSPISTTIVFAMGTGGTTGPVQAAPMSINIRALSADTPTCLPIEICPALLDTAYGFNTLHIDGINGSGQSIVIIESCQESNISSDLKTFDSFFKLPNPSLNIYYPQGKCTANYGWGPEIAIDVEWSHALAPAATIDLIIANQPSFADLFGAWSFALKNHLGDEISNSWGSAIPTACSSSTGELLKEAAAVNVTVTASTGDSGAWTSGPGQTPANCLGVLSVGGTTLDMASNGRYEGESAWSDGGGGYVKGTKEPSFQNSVSIKDPRNLLGKPDVSSDANPLTGVWIYETPDEGGWSCCWGGTSVSNAAWAGFLSDVNQIRLSNGLATAGYLNPFLYLYLYGVGGTSILYNTNFHDINKGSNGFTAGKGWDAASGIGSFQANNLAFTIGDNSAA